MDPDSKKSRLAWYTEVKHRFPYGKFRRYLLQLQENRQIHCELVEPSYTSKICPNCHKEGKKGYLLYKKEKKNFTPLIDSPAFKPQPIHAYLEDCSDDFYPMSVLTYADIIRIAKSSEKYKIFAIKKSQDYSQYVFYPHATGNFLFCTHCEYIVSRDIAGALNIGQADSILHLIKIIMLLSDRFAKSQSKTTFHKLKKWVNLLSSSIEQAVFYFTLGHSNGKQTATRGRKKSGYYKKAHHAFISFKRLVISQTSQSFEILNDMVKSLHTKLIEYNRVEITPTEIKALTTLLKEIETKSNKLQDKILSSVTDNKEKTNHASKIIKKKN
jgi:hypothetical protein